MNYIIHSHLSFITDLPKSNNIYFVNTPMQNIHELFYADMHCLKTFFIDRDSHLLIPYLFLH